MSTKLPDKTTPERCPGCGAMVYWWPCLECKQERHREIAKVAVVKKSLITDAHGMTTVHISGHSQSNR